MADTDYSASHWPDASRDWSSQSPAYRDLSTQKSDAIHPPASMDVSATSTLSKAQATFEANFSGIPTLVSPQTLSLTESENQEEWDLLDSTLEALEESQELLAQTSEEKMKEIFSRQQAEQAELHHFPISLTEFMKILNKVMRELKKVQKNIEQEESLRREAMRQSLEMFAELQGIDTLSKYLLIRELELLKVTNKERLYTGDRIILGKRPDLMLKLVNYGVLPPMVTGGPYDGYAKRAAAQGAFPYDNPAYAVLAESLPSGWEELSIQELDQVIDQLKASMAPLPASVGSSFLSTVTRHSLAAADQVYDPYTMGSPGLMQMLALRLQLEDLKKKAGENGTVFLGQYPELVAAIWGAGILPPMQGGPHHGMAQKAAAAGEPPYDNAVYARVVGLFPSGWEDQTPQGIDTILKRLDQIIDGNMRTLKSLSMFPPNDLIEPYRSDALDMMTLSLGSSIFKNYFNFPIDEVHFDPLRVSPSRKNISDMLLASVAIIESLYENVHAFKGKNLNQVGQEILELWLKTNMADRMASDLFGYRQSTPLERHLIAKSLVSFALVAALINTQSSSRTDLLNTLRNLAQTDRFALFARLGIQLLENQKGEEAKVVTSIIRTLTEKIQQKEEELENLKMLEALLTTMIQRISQMLTHQETMQAQQGSDQKKEEGPSSIVHFQA
jgi:hypothetical protein